MSGFFSRIKIRSHNIPVIEAKVLKFIMNNIKTFILCIILHASYRHMYVAIETFRVMVFNATLNNISAIS